ncbi:MAG: thioether cross-link-forming SCIFF peptide maturase [Thermoanaerobacterales bacterium]|nr:thioether cross-link-forming SCIFF peptide maturase [Thermoanaerobacterales bacterium]
MPGQIHKFKLFDKNIVLDINSGSVFEVDDIVYEFLDDKKTLNETACQLGSKYGKAEVLQAINEIQDLKKKNMLYSTNDFSFVIEKLNGSRNVKALCLNVAHDCNLRCGYCFASKGDYRGKRLLMPASVGRESVDFLIEHSGGRKNLEIDFFGGEPLLALKTVKEVISYARSLESKYKKKFHFTITTNATNMDDDIIDFLHKNMDNVVMSLDGRKEVNDFFRVKPNGSGSYDYVLNNILKMVELRERDNKEYYVRGTFTRYNLDFAQDVFHIASLGVKQISLEPVVGKEGSFLLRPEDLELLYRQYHLIAEEQLKRKKSGITPFNFYHFNIDIFNSPCVYKRMSACGSGNEYLAVTPEGDIFPCHQFVGNDKFYMGNIKEKKLNMQIVDLFKNTHIFAKPRCSSCWARFYCSGGCNANNFQINGDLKEPYDITCSLQKKRIEYAIYMNLEGNVEENTNGMYDHKWR